MLLIISFLLLLIIFNLLLVLAILFTPTYYTIYLSLIILFLLLSLLLIPLLFMLLLLFPLLYFFLLYYLLLLLVMLHLVLSFHRHVSSYAFALSPHVIASCHLIIHVTDLLLGLCHIQKLVLTFTNSILYYEFTLLLISTIPFVVYQT